MPMLVKAQYASFGSTSVTQDLTTGVLPDLGQRPVMN
jgi:hypothetical protein